MHLLAAIARAVRGKQPPYMHGHLHFEFGLWQCVAKNFKKTQIIYDNLIKVVQATSGNKELCKLYKSKVDELTTNLRYCSYNSMGSEDGECGR